MKPPILAWLLLTTGGVVTGSQASVPVSAFNFSLVQGGSGVMPDNVTFAMTSIPGIGECGCRIRCLSNSECLGFGFNKTTGACILSRQLPVVKALGESEDVWLWYARSGRRQLNQPCSSQNDCVVLGSECRDRCMCRNSFEATNEGFCRKRGSFISAGYGRLTGSPTEEKTDVSIEECKSICTANFTCMAFDFSPDEKRCTFYNVGITSDVGSGRKVESFIWKFPAADGKHPAGYQLVGGRYLGLAYTPNGLGAPHACYPDGAILFSDMTESARNEVFSSNLSSQWFVVGVDSIEKQSNYVTSDGSFQVKELDWSKGQPGNRVKQRCTHIRSEGLNDMKCEQSKHSIKIALCEFIGENLALHGQAWLSAPSDETSASHGIDGNLTSFVQTVNPRSGRVSFTVDLGGLVQVTSVLLASRKDCCEPDVNINTEYRVSLSATGWEADNSARCVLVTPAAVPMGYARMFRCETPATGRYLRVIRRKQILDFVELAVFGNRLHR